MIEAYALVFWYMGKQPREYGELFREGRGEVVEIFKQLVGRMGGVLGLGPVADRVCVLGLRASARRARLRS